MLTMNSLQCKPCKETSNMKQARIVRNSEQGVTPELLRETRRDRPLLRSLPVHTLGAK